MSSPSSPDATAGRPMPTGRVRACVATAWLGRSGDRDRERQHAVLIVDLHVLGVERVGEEELARVGPGPSGTPAARAPRWAELLGEPSRGDRPLTCPPR